MSGLLRLVAGLFALVLDAGAAVGGAAEPCGVPAARLDVLTFHGDARRLGWNDREPDLTPAAVGGPGFGPRWASPPLDPAALGGRVHPPHLYATPLYVDALRLRGGPHAGRTVGAVVAATSAGWVYAIHAVPRDCGAPAVPPGTVLWRTPVAEPVVVPALDGGMPLGILSTPVIDVTAVPPRVYVTALDARAGWQATALDLQSGVPLPGWPVVLGPSPEASQRAALALAPGGDRLYVAFGGFVPGRAGVVVAVDTRRPALAATFVAGPSGGGMWSPGGPALDAAGRVYMTTGNGPAEGEDVAGAFGSSLLEWSASLRLTGIYTPFNHCVLDRADMDLAGPVLLPGGLIAFGGKQGLVYLVARDRLAAPADRRPPCRDDPRTDRSLHPPGAPGPLRVFGPSTETHALLDHARMRTTPAYFADGRGARHLFVTGATKAGPISAESVPPGLVRLAITGGASGPPYLAEDAREMETTLVNPGSPVVSSQGGRGAVVWVLDPAQPRLAPLVGPAAARPVLYAFDGLTLRRLWRSGPGELEVGGKYATPTVARGLVFVGTDRIRAFGRR